MTVSFVLTYDCSYGKRKGGNPKCWQIMNYDFIIIVGKWSFTTACTNTTLSVDGINLLP
jgi:hypothetical protein